MFDEGPPVRNTLDATLNMAAARPLATELLGLRGAPIVIDASNVKYIGAQCAQVLASAAMTWRCDAMRFEIVDPSPAFSDGLHLLGLVSFFKHQEAL